MAFLVQFAAVNWHKYGEVTVIISLAIIAVILAVISQTNYVLIAYIGYILITSMHHTLITAARSVAFCPTNFAEHKILAVRPLTKGLWGLMSLKFGC